MVEKDLKKLEAKAKDLGEKVKRGETTLLKAKKEFKREIIKINMERNKKKQKLLRWEEINAIWTKYVNDEYGW